MLPCPAPLFASVQTTIQDDLWVWLKTMPPLLAFTAGLLWLLALLFKEDLKRAVVRGAKWLVARVLESGRPQKPLLTPEQHALQSERLMRLHQHTQRICDAMNCDHVTVYASMNGEYLKSRESVEKLLIVSEAVARADASEPRYMQTRRLVFTSDMPALWLDCCRRPYVLVQQGEATDEFVNRSMRQRGYQSNLLTQITTPLPGGGLLVLGLLACAWKGVRVEELDGPPPHITPLLLSKLAAFRTELSDLMEGPQATTP